MSRAQRQKFIPITNNVETCNEADKITCKYRILGCYGGRIRIRVFNIKSKTQTLVSFKDGN